MARLADGLVAGGLIAGVVWYTQRERQRARAEQATAERLARLLDARAQLAVAVAEADRALAAGNAAAAAVRARTPAGPAAIAAPAPPPAPPSSAPPVAPAPAGPRPERGLTRRFDELFARHGRGLPVPFLRALADAESSMNPRDRLGLINVVPKALADVNERLSATRFTAQDMRDPAKNITVAATLLRAIIDSYRRHHPGVANLAEDWNNPRFVELLVAGWNAGYSERAGVGRVVRYLAAQPAFRPDGVTVDDVWQAAVRARAADTLSNPRKLAFARSVAAAYLREAERDAREQPTALAAS